MQVIRPGCGLGEEVAPPASPTAADERAEIRRALAEPIGSPRLSELAASARTAAIVVSDVTRPCPSYRFLPALLAELASILAERITILFALGGHRGHTRKSRRSSSARRSWRAACACSTSHAAGCVPVGTTSRGTRLEVFEPYLDADLRICTGNIEYHYFAGFSGGAKAVVPGLCSYAAIRDNHSMMLAPTARAGVLDGNPVREDIDEAGPMIGIDFVFNVLLDEDKRIIQAVAGHFLEAHRAGAEAYERRCDLRIPEAADVVPPRPGAGRRTSTSIRPRRRWTTSAAPSARVAPTMLPPGATRASVSARSRTGCWGSRPRRHCGSHSARVRARWTQGSGDRRTAHPDRCLPRRRPSRRSGAQDVHAPLSRSPGRRRCGSRSLRRTSAMLIVPHGNRVEASAAEMSA